MAQQEIITRRRLPHWYVPGAMHFVTYRLAGTLPTKVVAELQARRRKLLEARSPHGMTRVQYRERVHKQLFAAYDAYLDKTRDVSWLGDPRVAAKVRGNLYHHHGGKFHLAAYCVLPNHVHVLLQPINAASGNAAVLLHDEDVGETDDGRSPLSVMMHSLKSYTAHDANKLLRRTGSFWQRESYDHWVRDEDELERIVNYIRANPVSAGLVSQPEDWYFCSCHDRFLTDGDTSAWLRWES